MWLIKPGKGSRSIDLSGTSFWNTKEGDLVVLSNILYHTLKYNSVEEAQKVLSAIVDAIKQNKPYLSPTESDLPICESMSYKVIRIELGKSTLIELSNIADFASRDEAYRYEPT